MNEMDFVQQTISEFIETVESSGLQDLDRRQLLIKSLDKLAYCYWLVPNSYELGDEVPIVPKFSVLYDLISKHFSTFGIYIDQAKADYSKMDLAEPPLAIGDAVDDLTDVLHDMHAVAWHFSNGQKEVALATFRFGFMSHWGMHLRSLQAYLHAEIDLES
jgi:Domain of unknown function (DUF5063)